jgi:hypothetical protein
MKEIIEELMENQEISTFEKGKYNDTVREVYAALLSANVGRQSVRHFSNIFFRELFTTCLSVIMFLTFKRISAAFLSLFSLSDPANSPKLFNISFIIVKKESAVPCTNSEIPTLYCPELVPICRPPYSQPFHCIIKYIL